MRRFNFGDTLREQIATLEKWCDDKYILNEILTEGHADVHYQGGDELPRNMNDAINALYRHDTYEELLPSDRVILDQVARVAKEVIPASQFTDKTTMLAAFCETLLACASDIAQWVAKDRGVHSSRLRLTVDTGAFVGTGIGLDGNEYATTATTIVLSRRPTPSIDAGRIPFSVVTMYPDITGRNEIGTLEATGRCYGWGLARLINHQDVGQKMYWQLREAGIPCSFDRRGNGSVSVVGYVDDVKVVLRYNEHSQFQGQILVEDESKTGLCKLNKATHLSEEQKSNIRAYEQQFHTMLYHAQDKHHVTIAEDSPMLAPIEQGTIVEDGQYRNITEIEDVL